MTCSLLQFYSLVAMLYSLIILSIVCLYVISCLSWQSWMCELVNYIFVFLFMCVSLSNVSILKKGLFWKRLLCIFPPGEINCFLKKSWNIECLLLNFTFYCLVNRIYISFFLFFYNSEQPIIVFCWFGLQVGAFLYFSIVLMFEVRVRSMVSLFMFSCFFVKIILFLLSQLYYTEGSCFFFLQWSVGATCWSSCVSDVHTSRRLDSLIIWKKNWSEVCLHANNIPITL